LTPSKSVKPHTPHPTPYTLPLGKTFSADPKYERAERLGKFKQFMPRYRDVKALGAVAAMIVPEEVARNE